MFRFEAGYGAAHRFGFYYREGETNLKSSTSVAATTAGWGTTGVPAAADILANRDKTTLEGLYYAFDNSRFHFDFEYATGVLGRRFPTLFATTAAAAGREHLDQKFLGYCLTGVYKMGHHQILARYDMLNYNSGDNWYTAASPYKVTVNAAPADYSPKYTETTVGYNYVFVPTKYGAAKLKLDYIMRSKNFLAPRAGQTGEKGGDSVVLSWEIAF
jgi:hypothetical protein